jgi:ABC-type polysaccharide/polyol phosphate transport system ATPase subunit
MPEIIELRNVSLSMPNLKKSRSFRQLLARPVNRNAKAQLNIEQHTILKNISLSIAAGDRVGLIGANGAGKSTLLRLLAGIFVATRGQLIIGGETSTLLDLNVGFDLEATGNENIPIAAAQLGYPSHKLSDLINFVEDFTELGDALNLPVRSMSSGMQMRLAFAITVFSTANILLIDEIIGVGDERFIKKATKYLRETSATKTLLLASHAEFMIHDFCNKAAVFHLGELIHFGDVAEGFRIYKQTFAD